METYSRKKKVVIIIEAVILKKVIEVIENAGASGYTIINVTGKGTRGVRSDQDSFLHLFKNLMIEVITDEKIAGKITEEVTNKFYKHYAGFIYIEDVVTIPRI